ncbi:MAG: sodium/glutamate symporter [Verrucomicrobiota bacterium]
MIFSAWIFVWLALPVLLLGELLVRKIKILARFNIPAPVVGGLLISLLILLARISGVFTAELPTKTAAPWWSWFVTTGTEWSRSPSINVHQPLLVAFFTCIGLNASWSIAKRGSFQVLIFLLASTTLAIVQNGVGVMLAKLLGVSPLLGIVCGSATMTGGHGTALGFAGMLEGAGLKGAGVLGVAAATFGLIAGGLVGGPLGGGLIRRFGLQSSVTRDLHMEAGKTGESGILQDFRALAGFGKVFLLHLMLVIACLKIGAWISYILQQPFHLGGRDFKLTFPVYMGAMILGLLIRNLVDISGARLIKTEVVDTLSSVSLGLFLAIAMMSLNLLELASAAVPMLVIVSVQVILVILFAWFVTFRIMGKDFDAAIMAGGHCGFGLGATSSAVANMKSLVETFGPAPRAFLVVPIVGGFLIDIFNAMNITFFVNLVK